MTSEEIRELAKLVRSKPTIANKYDHAADQLQRWVLNRLSADEQREFERIRLLSLLREVLACGVSYEAKAHVELQVHRTLLADILTALQDAEKGETQ